MGSVAQYFILDNNAMTESFGSFKLNFFKLKFPIKLNYHFKIKDCIFQSRRSVKRKLSPMRIK